MEKNKVNKPEVEKEVVKNNDDKKFILGKINLFLIALGFIIIVVGFALMTGSTTTTEFNPDIFSTRRITVGPMIAFLGFMFMIFAIMFKPKSKNK